MSLSSVAQNSALRIAAASAAPPSRDSVATTAAQSAVAASRNGVDDAEAVRVGQQAAATISPGPSTAPSAPENPLATIVAWIPTETIALYIAVTAALGDVAVPEGGAESDADFTSRWIWLGILLVITAATATALSYRHQKQTSAATKFTMPIFEVSAASVAFLVWALSLPNTPLRDIEGYDYSAWNSVLIMGGTLAIGMAAFAAGRSVDGFKVLADPSARAFSVRGERRDPLALPPPEQQVLGGGTATFRDGLLPGSEGRGSDH
jgi:hypothetical protein